MHRRQEEMHLSEKIKANKRQERPVSALREIKSEERRRV